MEQNDEERVGRLPKCRAWDEARKEWVNYGFCLRFDSNGDCEVLNVFAQSLRGQKLTLSFGVGIPDRNGKDIYGGDFVKWEIGEPPEGIYKVIWYEHGWYLEREDGWKEALYPNLADGKGSNLEVIGNIYEGRCPLK